MLRSNVENCDIYLFIFIFQTTLFLLSQLLWSTEAHRKHSVELNSDVLTWDSRSEQEQRIWMHITQHNSIESQPLEVCECCMLSVCVHVSVCVCCLSAHLCESLNSVSCFLLCVSRCSTDTARAWTPYCFYCPCLRTRALPLCSILSLSLTFSLLHAGLCFTLISTGWNLTEERQIKPELKKKKKRRRRQGMMEGCWRVLLRGLEKPADIRESHWGERRYESCCAVFFLFLPLSFPLCFPLFYFPPRYGESALRALGHAVCLIWGIRIQGNKSKNVTAPSQVGT